MKCPVDGELLAITNRGKIEIDYCQTCRGVWLDRGELDKIIDESSAYDKPRASEQHYVRDTKPQEPHHKKRRENFLGDLFDF